MQLLDSTCRPILTKPKPKVEPPKEEASKAGDKDAKESGAGKNDKGDAAPEPASATNGPSDSNEDKIDMELD